MDHVTLGAWRHRLLAVVPVTLALVVSACGSGSDGSGSPTPPDPPPIAPALPQDVQVVAGDGNDSELRNTVSWRRDSTASSHVVYWGTTPGITTDANELRPAAGARQIVHSGVDVVPGNRYYYRVEARTEGAASALSREVPGTPQMAITGNSLNDVAWNGVDRLVAVGDAGVILASANGTLDAWQDVSTSLASQALSAVTWDKVNLQFLVVGAGSTVLRGDGFTWQRVSLASLPGAVNLNDVAWLGDRYIAVGNRGTIVTSNGDGSLWMDRNSGIDNASLTAVASNGTVIVIVGTNGTILTSTDAIAWTLQPKPLNNDLNDMTWDGAVFTVVGSNDTILTSPDGTAWTPHTPGTSDINFVAVTQWDAGLPTDPVVVTVGSSGTCVIRPADDPGIIVPTGTSEQLGGVSFVDAGVGADAYFVIVGNDGTVLTAAY